MKRMLFLFLLVFFISMPATGHAFGILKYLGDALSNQLGLDRGPIPKVTRQSDPCKPNSYLERRQGHVYKHRFLIQAEGF